MNRRWFLGAVGSAFGALVAPGAFKTGMTKVEIVQPEIITDSGIDLLMHQISDRQPIAGAAGFHHACVWEHLRTGEFWVNVGSVQAARWQQMQGDKKRFLEMVYRERLRYA